MYWWVKYIGANCLEPCPVPPVGYLVEQLTDPTFFPEFANRNFVFLRDESVEEKILDFARFLSPTFFVRERAFRLLERCIAPSSRTMEITCEGILYHYIQIDQELDLFDYESSSFTRWGMYERIEDEVDTVSRVVIKPPPTDCPDLFRLRGRNGVRMNIIASDRFKRIYEENNLTGLFFTEAERLDN